MTAGKIWNAKFVTWDKEQIKYSIRNASAKTRWAILSREHGQELSSSTVEKLETILMPMVL